MNPIEFEIKLTLNADLDDSQIKLQFENKNIFLKKKDKKEVVLSVSYKDTISRIKLIDFTGFKPISSPHIKIEGMSINGYSVKDFYHLLSFDMTDNLYVENKKIECTQMIDFNGTLYIEVNKHRDRLTWFPLTFSKNKSEIVFRNDTLNCTSDIGCWDDSCIHTPLWQKFNFDQYVKNIHYDYITLGCSITAGTGILKKQAWPSLIEQNGKNVLNFSVPGGGNDQIFLNVRELLRKKVKFSKMIILLPGAGRQLLRISKHGYFFNNLIVANLDFMQTNFNIYFEKNELFDIYIKTQKKLLMSDFHKRDSRIIKKLLSLLYKKSIDFYISSWDDDVYNVLKSCVKKQNLLQKFNENRDKSVGIDGMHPAENIHKKWIENIKKQISH